MRRSRLLMPSVLALCVLVAGAFGCAKKELKTDSSLRGPAGNLSDTENGKAGMPQKTQAPPAPSEQTYNEEGPSREELALVDIHFDLDSCEIKPEEAIKLEKAARFIRTQIPWIVMIEGNCDERGTVEYNLALGERRAEAARNFLINMGVDARRLKIISYGKGKPADPGHDEEAWAKNRRDHFVVERFGMSYN